MKLTYVANMRLPTEKAHGVQIMKMCEAFAREGVEVELIVPRRRNNLKNDPFEYYGVDRVFSIKTLPTVDLVGIIPRLGLWIEATVFSFFLIFYLRGRKEIIYSRDNISLYFLSFFFSHLFWESHVGSWNFVVRRVVKKVDGIISITEGGKNFIVEKGVSPDEVIVARDGVDIGKFDVNVTRKEARELLGLPLDKYIAMYVGLFDDWKGYRVLLQAAQSLKEKGVEVVMVGGTASQVKELEKQYPHVHFMGYRAYTALPVNQKAADALVLPNSAHSKVSKTFTSPLKLFSYMVSGRPIVASNIPALREVLTDGSNAVLVEPDDAQALEDGILKVIHDNELSQKIAVTAFEDVKKYTWQKRAQKILNFITDSL